MVCLNTNMVSFYFTCKNWPPFEKSPKFDLGYYISDKVISFEIIRVKNQVHIKSKLAAIMLAGVPEFEYTKSC
jgi:hypothetical protein